MVSTVRAHDLTEPDFLFSAPFVRYIKIYSLCTVRQSDTAVRVLSEACAVKVRPRQPAMGTSAIARPEQV